MPNKNTQNQNETKNYHAQIKRLDKEASKLGKQLQSLQQREKASRSASAKKNIRDKVKMLEREIAEKTYEMITLNGTWEKELYRRKKCKVPASRCPLAPFRPAL